jgi:hypothetical protein
MTALARTSSSLLDWIGLETMVMGLTGAELRMTVLAKNSSNIPNAETGERREGSKGGKEINGITGVRELVQWEGKGIRETGEWK